VEQEGTNLRNDHQTSYLFFLGGFRLYNSSVVVRWGGKERKKGAWRRQNSYS
jgi:hypothetical protein